MPAQITNPSPWNDPPPLIPLRSTANLAAVRAGFHCKRVGGESFLTHPPKIIYYYLFALARPYPNNSLFPLE